MLRKIISIVIAITLVTITTVAVLTGIFIFFIPKEYDCFDEHY